MKNKLFIILLLALVSVLLIAGTPHSKASLTSKSRKVSVPTGWTEPVDISPNLQYWSFDSRVVTDKNGVKAYAIWVEEGGGSKRICFNDNESGKWGNAQNMSIFIIGEYPTPEVNVDKNGDAIIIFQSRIPTGNYEVYFNKMHDGKWQGFENVSRTPNGGSMSPSIMIDRRNNDYYAIWQDDVGRPTENATYWKGEVQFKRGGTGSWQSGGEIPDNTDRCYFHDAVMNDKGVAYCVYDDRSDFGVAHVYFIQNATPAQNTSWTQAVDVSENTGMWNNWGFSYPRLTCDNDGNVYVVWTDNKTGNWEINFRKRVNGKWYDRENLSQTLTESYHPTVAINKRNGEIYVAWGENLNGNWEVYFKEYKKVNSKWGWQPTVNFSQNGGTQDYPTLYTDDVGGIHMVYTDNQSGVSHIYYTKKPGSVDVFPPLNLKTSSKLVKPSQSNPNVTKTTTLTWDENPKNAELAIQKYRIFRKKAGDPDANYALLAEVEGTVMTYENTGLLNAQKYTYALTALAEGGFASPRSDPVTDKDLYPPVTYAPINITLDTDLDSSQTTKLNTLNWEQNPQNSNLNIINYKILRKESQQPDTSYTLLTSVSGGVFTYNDLGLSLAKKYTYRLKAVSDWLVESPNSAVVEEIKIFYPLNLSLSVAVNSYLFYKEKINTISWKQNPLNEAVTVSSYKIYRKKAGESDSSYNLLTTLSGSTFECKDRKLSLNEKYSYRLTAVDSQGNESTPTISVNEI
jgi:hypothetical protein